ncbi:MAG TPA: TonB-dependent receptor [Aliidongia sp.]|uniref:TonB-dependent receptor n=1 Tax=Aliidongia sp. TaxID=1914230 RepID=UPI002DDD5915|nr:TonB-dependent receptor [Aliidongia sp.]HEV2675842.1 TonB-dependent receptor [Aliidongia sp.]
MAMMTVAGLAHAQDASTVTQTAQAAPVANTPAAPVTEQIEVTGIRLSLQKSMDVKRAADGVVEAVSATDIGQLPDKNVADALQRLPGITTIQSAAAGSGGFGENDRVEIRGTAPSLTQTLIDGHAVSTGDWFFLDQLSASSRSVSYALFPSEIVDHAIVYKSSQADLPEGGTAGSINIVTRAPLDFKDPITAEVSLGGAYSDLADRAGPQFNGLVAWKNDSNTLGVMVQGFREQRYLRRDGQEELGYTQIPTTATVPGANGTTVANPFPKGMQGAYYPEIINNALFEQERLRQGGDAAIEFKPNNHWDFRLDGFYSYLNAPNYNQGDLIDVNDFVMGHNTTGPVAPSAYTVQNGILTSATFPGSTARGNPGINDIYRPDAGEEVYYINGQGTWKPTSNLSIHTQAGYSRGKGGSDQFAYGTTSGTGAGASYGMNGTDPLTVGFPGAVGLNDPSNYGGFMGDSNQDWVGIVHIAQLDTDASGQVDVQYDFDDGLIQSVKGGIRFTEHERNEVEAENFNCYSGACGTVLTNLSNGQFPSNFGSGAGISTPFVLSVDPNALQSLIQNFVNSTGQTTAGRYYWNASFKIKENTTAGYLMAKFGGENFQGNFGVRIASTKDNIDTFDTNPAAAGVVANTKSAFGTYFINHHTQDYVDILPSFSVKYDVSPNVVARFSAGQTMTRPDYYALAGGAALNDTLLSGTQGNPGLKPTRSTNLDVSAEWYYAPRASLTAGLFDMQMTSTFDDGTIQENAINITNTTARANPLGMANPLFSTYTVTAPTNNSGASKGLELSWQQPIAWGFGFASNYTFAQSSQNTPTPGIGGRQMLGASKHTGNLTAYYENDIGIDAHLAYTAHSQIYQGIDRAEKYFQDAGGELDGAIGYKINNHYSVSLDVLNISDSKDNYVTSIHGIDVPRATYDNGRTFYLQLTAKY